MKKIILISATIFAYCILVTANCFSQGTAINTSGTTADNSAMLDISSTSKGLRIPRVALTSTTDIVTVPNPVNSLLVFDTLPAGDITETGYYYWDGGNSKWVKLATGSSSSGGGGVGNYQVFDASGTFNVPVGVTKIKVEVWGAGGGGGIGTYGGGGGGGGGYVNAILDNLVSSYSVSIGSGGGQQGNGLNSSFGGGGITITGNYGYGGNNGGRGGDGGDGTITGTPLSYFIVKGTPGENGISSTGSNYMNGSGGSGGNGGGGGAGGSNTNCYNKNGRVPGGGGGGGNGSTCTGGSGAGGRVIVWW